MNRKLVIDKRSVSTMENETPFAVDVEQDARLRASAASNVAGDSHAANPADEGDKGEIRETVCEETPLISDGGADTHFGAAGLPGDGDDGRHETPWLGAKEFEAMPWWRRPSVGSGRYCSIQCCLLTGDASF